MPPKRAASAASKAGNSTKKARSTTPNTDAAAAEEDWETASSSTADENGVPKVKTKSSKRWSAFSVSRNLDVGYRMQTADPAKAYDFVCLCQPPFDNGNDSDEDGEEDEDDEEENAATEMQKKPEKARCDGGKKCLCNKPAADHPDHIWVLSSAGRVKFFAQRDHADLRDPDNFRMYTFNDHAAYGVLEVVQNLILDFEEAKGSWKEMWAVVEALTFLLKTDVGMSFARMDDGEGAEAVSELAVRLFMNMLAYLEREGLLKKESEIKNLGLIMALWMSLPGDFTSYSLLEESNKESLGPAKDKKKWQPHLCANQIAAYAKKHEIKLVGPHNLDEILEDVDDDADLPNPESNTEKADMYGYAKAFRAYKKDYGGVPSMMAGFARKRPGNQPMGGDSLDITSWTSAERKRAAFSKKDPLSKRELDAIKQGMVVSLG